MSNNKSVNELAFDVALELTKLYISNGEHKTLGKDTGKAIGRQLNATYHSVLETLKQVN